MEDRATSARLARSAARDELVGRMGDWSGGSGPLYRQLARALGVAIERGELAPGARLPSERSLAAAAAVSRGVAVAAYDELVAEGSVQRRIGSGTFVAGGPALPPGREGSVLVGQLVGRGEAPELIDLSISVLDDPAGLPEVTVGTDDLAGLGPSSPWGLEALRERIAERLGAIGLPSTAEQVVVTTGAQQGLALAMACWVRPGDRVVVDDPTYPGVLGAVAAAGARAIGVPVDRHGPRLDELAAALAAGPALLSVQSGPHSPTGGRASEHRRRAIASLAVDHRVPVVEDHALFALDWSGHRPPAPIAAHAPDHPIVVVGSYSKRFWSGLRVGFVRAPAPVARRLVRVKAVHDLGSSIPAQALALGLLEHPDHERFVAERNGALARRADLLVRLLRQALPRWKVAAPDGGLSLWVALPEPVAPRFADIARRHGVVVATAEGISADPERHRHRLRLTFARPEADLRDGVRRLASAWQELADQRS